MHSRSRVPAKRREEAERIESTILNKKNNSRNIRKLRTVFVENVEDQFNRGKMDTLSLSLGFQVRSRCSVFIRATVCLYFQIWQ